MKRGLLSIFCIIGFISFTYGQYYLKENNMWAFGYHAGLDFTNGSPVPFTTSMGTDPSKSSHGVPEGCASLCDPSGKLLFYTSGDTIWNKNHNVMSGGAGLIAPYATGSTTQAALIVPVINNPDRFYVFSLEEGEGLLNGDVTSGRLFYSVVDMNLDNGLGGVALADKHIALDSGLAEKMTAVAGDNCNIWLLVHNNTGTSHKVYEITDTGVSRTPKVFNLSNIGGYGSYLLGEVKFSPNRRKIAVASIGAFGPETGLELCDFDPAGGTISNVIQIDSVGLFMGLCFSPDNSKLYTVTFDNIIYQFDLALPTTAAIIQSKTRLDSVAFTTNLKLAPNGKIYVTTNYDSISVIESPDRAGAACNYHHAITLPAGQYAGFLPNDYVKPLTDTIYSAETRTITAGDSIIIDVPGGYFNWQWNDGTSDTKKVITTAGVYWLSYSNYCVQRTDTFIVQYPTSVLSIDNKQSLIVYPNPATQYVVVDVAGLEMADGSIAVFDETGRKVFHTQYNIKSPIIDIGNLANGFYRLVYTNSKDSAVRLTTNLIITR